MNMPTHYPDRTVERLCTYRRTLRRCLEQGKARVFSHELAAAHQATPAQVRRDLMTIGFTGSPARGYDVAALLAYVGRILDPPGGTAAVVIGVGHLGRALLAYFTRDRSPLHVAAAFDSDPDKVGTELYGCPVHAIDRLEEILDDSPASVGIIAVPAEHAQAVADRLIHSGIRGFVNFAPVILRLPPHVTCEDMDIAVSLEKVAYHAGHNCPEER